MHIRYLLTRVQFVTILILTSLLAYFIWKHSPLIEQNWRQALSSPSSQLIVFGDFYSDVQDTADGNTEDSKLELNNIRWTEVLCRQLGLQEFSNYAQSVVGTGGVVTDQELYFNATHDRSTDTGLSDLGIQVQEWKRSRQKGKSTPIPGDHIVAVTIGYWEIWKYSELKLDDAKNIVLVSIHSLFDQLTIIADSLSEPATFVIPSLWDVTFTPQFTREIEGAGPLSRRHSEQQHKLVYLSMYWNMALAQYAASWSAGTLYIPDWNTWLLDQIRAAQMQQLGLSDSLGLGTETPMFKDVSSPCLKAVFAADGTVIDKDTGVAMSQCEEPRHHLWWDDAQFGPAAHEILGEMAARLLRSNETANEPANANANDATMTADLMPPHLVPSLAPGN